MGTKHVSIRAYDDGYSIPLLTKAQVSIATFGLTLFLYNLISHSNFRFTATSTQASSTRALRWIRLLYSSLSLVLWIVWVVSYHIGADDVSEAVSNRRADAGDRWVLYCLAVSVGYYTALCMLYYIVGEMSILYWLSLKVSTVYILIVALAYENAETLLYLANVLEAPFILYEIRKLCDGHKHSRRLERALDMSFLLLFAVLSVGLGGTYIGFRFWLGCSGCMTESSDDETQTRVRSMFCWTNLCFILLRNIYTYWLQYRCARELWHDYGTTNETPTLPPSSSSSME